MGPQNKGEPVRSRFSGKWQTADKESASSSVTRIMSNALRFCHAQAPGVHQNYKASRGVQLQGEAS
jgi:hypothetical protein